MRRSNFSVYTIKIIFILSFLSVNACASSQLEQYRQEAKAYCDLYHPDRWKNNQSPSALENLAKLNAETREVVKSKAFLAIFDRLAKTGYTDFYTAIQPEISQLIGQEWQCENAKKFYAIDWERKNKVTKAGSVLLVTQNRYLKIDNKEIKVTENEKIATELNKLDKKKKVTIKVPEDFSQQELEQLLVPFRTAGVQKLSVVFY